MKELLETIVRPLLDVPDALSITEQRRGTHSLFTVKLAPEDIGRVIGKGGKRASAIRTIMKARGFQEHRHVTINIGE